MRHFVVLGLMSGFVVLRFIHLVLNRRVILLRLFGCGPMFFGPMFFGPVLFGVVFFLLLVQLDGMHGRGGFVRLIFRERLPG